MDTNTLAYFMKLKGERKNVFVITASNWYCHKYFYYELMLALNV